MVEKSITVRAPINIALIKYWGKRNEELIIPYNDSISLTINDLYAETRIVVSNELKEDLVVINDAKIDLRNSRRFIPVFNVSFKLHSQLILPAFRSFVNWFLEVKPGRRSCP